MLWGKLGYSEPALQDLGNRFLPIRIWRSKMSQFATMSSKRQFGSNSIEKPAEEGDSFIFRLLHSLRFRLIIFISPDLKPVNHDAGSDYRKSVRCPAVDNKFIV